MGRWSALALVFLGCTHAPEREVAPLPTSASGPASARLAVVDALPWPYRLERAAVWVDGVLLQDGGPRVIEALALAPGDHTVRAEALASYRATPVGSEPCQVKLVAVEGLRVGTRPARITVEIGARGVTEDFAARPALRIAASGAQHVPHHALPHDPHDTSAPDTPAATLAALRARIERARTASDAAAVSCYEDKLDEMRRLMTLRERRIELLGQPTTPRDPSDTVFHGLVLVAIDQRIARTYGASNACASAAGESVAEAARAPSGQCAAALGELIEPSPTAAVDR
jgi:hypothetical protein